MDDRVERAASLIADMPWCITLPTSPGEIFAKFRHTADDDPPPLTPELSEIEDTEVSGIRCPLCKWRPLRSDTWMCWDCDHPEYYYGGCGTEWNTFETGGICPTCLHQWIWTSCYRCFMWSKHEDWYEKE